MKHTKLILFYFLFSAVLFAQEKDDVKVFQEASSVINIEVPVRVFESGTFVDNLKLADFEVFENGKPQELLAVYRIKENLVQKREEKERFIPHTKRLFVLFFELATYDPRIDDAVDYFVNEVLLSSDDLIALTPTKTYRLGDKEVLTRPREDIANELKELIRKDVMIGNSESRAVQRDIIEAVAELAEIVSGEIKNPEPFYMEKLETFLISYTSAIDRLKFIRDIDQLKLMDFANILKSRPEQKFVFMFYEREALPRIDTKYWDKVSTLWQSTGGHGLNNSIVEYHEYLNQDITIDLKPVKQAYADAAASLHFLFVSKPKERIQGIEWIENTNDVFAAFSEMAESSGGLVDSSSRADKLFQTALDASENYYLLYYAPQAYEQDGKFREIKVRVKGRNYKIAHRQGYYTY